jgi:hypothetical protein
MTEYDRCQRCRRALKNPEARKRGYGAICFAKIRAAIGPLFEVEEKS